MTIKELSTYAEKARVYELPLVQIEMFQVKMFYYQKMQGVRPFRFSMSSVTGYLYFQDAKEKNQSTLQEFLDENSKVQDLLRILSQIKLIIDESSTFLLYPEMFIPDVNQIILSQNEDRLSVDLIYLPLQKDTDIQYKEFLITFITRVAKYYNQKNHMEGFYYFTRVLDELKRQSELEEGMRLEQILSHYLQEEETRKQSRSVII